MADYPAPKDGLATGPNGPTIGGTHNVSVKLDPDKCVTGSLTPIPGDGMPYVPADKPYLPGN